MTLRRLESAEQWERQTQDPHILRAIGRAWGWRRRMEAGEFGAACDLARHLKISERQINRRLRLAYLSPTVLKRQIYRRETLAVTLLNLSDVATLPWIERESAAFEEKNASD